MRRKKRAKEPFGVRFNFGRGLHSSKWFRTRRRAKAFAKGVRKLGAKARLIK